MDPADIKPDDRTLVRRSAAHPETINWNDLEKAEVCRLPSLFEETGVVFDLPTGSLYVRETQPGYKELFVALDIEKFLPSGWYEAAEAGELFQVVLKNKHGKTGG